MEDGFLRVAAATPAIRVADCAGNAERILEHLHRAARESVRLLCLPELCITGYTCGDLFRQRILLSGALDALEQIVKESANIDLVGIVGLPLEVDGKLYNTAAVFCGGKLLGLVPKTHLPTYGEFYELRHFSPAPAEPAEIFFAGEQVPFGRDLLFRCTGLPAFTLGVEICEDLWAPQPPSTAHAMAGATVVANLSASDEIVGKAAYRRSLASGQSGRLFCGYVYANAGQGESTSDMVFAGHNLICENGAVLSESPPFSDGWAVCDLDLHALLHDRQRNSFALWQTDHRVVPFALNTAQTPLSRRVAAHPFVPPDGPERSARCEEILSIQAAGLAQRLAHLGGCPAVIGISGGLDSCLALLAAARAFDKNPRLPKRIIAVTMPCFGTTTRTLHNAHRLCEALGMPCKEIDITAMVRQHLHDIGHSEDNCDVVYENAQARVRTLVLMNIANAEGGIVVGTGDLSELALGWATYNGDHMSMYGVNAGVPKTLVRHMVSHVAATTSNKALADTLADILATPVSPELLPPKDGDIAQVTESLVGPYELHDFFLYHIVRWGRTPSAILCLACHAFGQAYTAREILRWLQVFYRRFFSQQFKRNCLPDGPKVGSVTLSPRGDWRMPSDADASLWLAQLDLLEKTLPAGDLN